MIHLLHSGTTMTGIQEGDITPNAVDLRLDKVFSLDLKTPFYIDNTKKVHREQNEIKPNANGVFHLMPGYYSIVMENQIDVDDNEAGFVITRSTLVRNGAFLLTGLYDAGYEGPMVSGLYTIGGMEIAKGTRVGQYLTFDCQAVSKYDGDYQTK